jgi:hypothetical protein
MLATETEAAILKRVIRPEEGGISRGVAEELLRLGFDERDHARMAQLSTRAQEGELTAEEQGELDSYINVSHFIAFVQSKARISLKNCRTK